MRQFEKKHISAYDVNRQKYYLETTRRRIPQSKEVEGNWFVQYMITLEIVVQEIAILF